jgi:DNA-binding beta-propeller fold protein YncE
VGAVLQPAERTSVSIPASNAAGHIASSPAAATQSSPQRQSGRSSFLRNAAAGVTLAALLGCGNQYRPVITSINPVGPAGQPQKYAVAISSTGANTPGLVTIVDFSGDSVLITAQVGVNPSYFITDAAGFNGYTINGDASISQFDISTSLLSSAVNNTTLLPGSVPTTLFPQGSYEYVTEPGVSAIGQFTGNPPAPKQNLPVTANPVYVVGYANAQRIYALSQGTPGSIGQAAAIDVNSNTVTTNVPVGVTPVYGVMTADLRRAFILNKGSNTVSVINSQTNALDSFPGSVAPGTIAVGTAPVWADLAPTRNEVVVANAGDGVHNGSVTIFSNPLCNAASEPTNPNCDPTNPVDAQGFGQVLATVPVGVNPVVIAVLADGTRAYVANGGNPSLPCATVPVAGVSTGCSVSVINLTSNVVTATIPVSGHPNFLALTNGTPTGKVYVTTADNDYMTVIETDTDSVDTTVNLQGKGVMVRTTAP